MQPVRLHDVLGEEADRATGDIEEGVDLTVAERRQRLVRIDLDLFGRLNPRGGEHEIEVSSVPLFGAPIATRLSLRSARSRRPAAPRGAPLVVEREYHAQRLRRRA